MNSIFHIKNKIILSFALVMLFHGMSWGQSLIHFLDKAHQQNPAMQAVVLSYEAALKKAPQVEQLPQPSVGVGIPLLSPETRLGAQRLTLSAQQLFPWFGTQKAKKEVVLKQAKSQYEQIILTRLTLDFKLKSAYYRYYYLEKKEALLTKNHGLYFALEQVVLAQVESGKAIASDALRIQLEREAIGQEIKLLANEKEAAQAVLNALINAPQNTPIEIDTTNLEPAIPPISWEKRFQKVKEHPALKQFDWQTEQSQANLRLNDLEGKPSLGLGIDYSVVEPRTDAQPQNNGRDILMPKIKFTVPLYRKKIKAKKQEEEINQQRYALQKQEKYNGLLSELKRFKAALESAVLRFDLFKKQIALAQSSHKILLGAYSSEGKHFEELLALQRSLNDYELKQLKAILDSHLALINIERITNF